MRINPLENFNALSFSQRALVSKSARQIDALTNKVNEIIAAHNESEGVLESKS